MNQHHQELLEARDPNTTAPRLSELASSKNTKIGELVAQNPNTPEHILLSLAEDFPAEVASNPAFALCLLERPDFIQRLPWKAAQAMASCEETPDAITALLLSSSPRINALITKRHSPQKKNPAITTEKLQGRQEAPSEKAPLLLQYDGATDVGLVRSRNEDAFLIYHSEALSLFAVIDGMGGQGTGELAAKLTRDNLLKEAKRADKGAYNTQEVLREGLSAAHNAIKETRNSMGAAAATLLLQGHMATITHIGDSRVYLWRANKLSALTQDHSLLNEYLKVKRLTPEEIESFPHKNVITRAIGMGTDNDSGGQETTRLEVLPEDLFLLCTDGVSSVGTQVLEQTLSEEKTIEHKVQRLIALGNQAGGLDNMALILVAAYSIENSQ
jgi:PPM family protein phosphatase